MVHTIEVVEHEPMWATAFEREAAALSRVFGPSLVAVHHVGSTSVCGLAAKPILDILVVLHETATIDRFSAGMEGLGYRVRGECLDAEVPGTPGRFYFSKDAGGVRTHHVHACAADHPQVADLLVFRDYLRSHPEPAAAYEALKRDLARRHCHDNAGYMRGKDAFVKVLLDAARAWAGSTPRELERCVVPKTMKIGFLASHNGSNMQAIIDACVSGTLQAEPAVVISNNYGSGALARAEQQGIPRYHLSGNTHPDQTALDEAILGVLLRHNVDIVVLAGYMKKIGPRTLARFSGRILNIHPALLPKFGGRGMYGLRVHEAVIAAREQESGVSIHLVDGEYDAGPVIAQARVRVEPTDTPQSLAERILQKEHTFFPETLQRIVGGELRLSATQTDECSERQASRPALTGSFRKMT